MKSTEFNSLEHINFICSKMNQIEGSGEDSSGQIKKIPTLRERFGNSEYLSSYFNSQSNEGIHCKSRAFKFNTFCFVVALVVPAPQRIHGLINFDGVRQFVSKFFGEKLKRDNLLIGREKLVKLGILKNPSVFGSTIPDIVKLDGKNEKIPEFLKICIRNF